MDLENGLLSVLGESLGPSGVAEASRELEESMGTTRQRGSGQKPMILSFVIFEGQYIMLQI
jgi:hypothetical protein